MLTERPELTSKNEFGEELLGEDSGEKCIGSWTLNRWNWGPNKSKDLNLVLKKILQGLGVLWLFGPHVSRHVVARRPVKLIIMD